MPLITRKPFISSAKCPYLEDHESTAYAFWFKTFQPDIYEAMINQGFRRSGYVFYKNLCQDCCSCIPIRVDVANFKPSKSQRRVLKKNSDVTIIRNPVSFDQEGFLLYRKYCTEKHGSSKDKNDYTSFLIDSPIPTHMMRYYLDDKLLAIGWIDILPNSLSSVYLAFDPDYSYRSLGVFSALKEIELCIELKKAWLQMGFWVRETNKMSYKSQYRPCQILVDGIWQVLSHPE